MQPENTNSDKPPKFMFFDTNIYSRISKDDAAFEEACSYIEHHALTLIVTAYLLAELYSAERQHPRIAAFFKRVNAAFIEPHTWALRRDLEAYPSTPAKTPAILHSFGHEEELAIVATLRGSAASRMSESLRKNSEDVPGRFQATKDNFLPDPRTGVYSDAQVTEFCDLWVREDLHRAFPGHPKLSQLRLPLTKGSFPSARLHTTLIFWKFYRGKRSPTRHSDLGDRAHAAFLPFCAEVVLENDQANLVGQVRRKFPDLFLAPCTVYTMTEFFQRIHASR